MACDTKLNILSWNCQSLRSSYHSTQLAITLNDHSPIHIVTLCETHTTDDDALSTLISSSFPDYYTLNVPCVLSDRNRSGGLLFLVHKTRIPFYIPCPNFAYRSSECSSACAAIQFPFGSQTILLMLVYRHPSCSRAVTGTIMSHIQSAASFARSHSYCFIVTGDFNRLSAGKLEQLKLRGDLYNLNHIHTDNAHTHIDGGCLDLTFTNSPSIVSSFTVAYHMWLLSDHFPTLLSLRHSDSAAQPLAPPCQSASTSIPVSVQRLDSVYDFRWHTSHPDIDWQHFQSYLQPLLLQLSNRFDSEHAQDRSASEHQSFLDSFASDLVWSLHQSAIQTLIPMHYPDPSNPPRFSYWYHSPRIKMLLRGYHRSHSAYLRDRQNPDKRAAAQSAKSQWTQACWQARQQSWQQLCARIQDPNRARVIVWKQWRRSVGGHLPVQKVLDAHGQPTGSMQQSLDALALHYASVSCAPSPSEYGTTATAHLHTYRTRSQQPRNPDVVLPGDLTILAIHAESVARVCKHMSVNTSAGPDAIPMSFLKHGGTPLYEALTRLFTYSFQHAVVPTIFKRANVSPILKPNKPADRSSSYRPISVTSVIMRLFERVLVGSIWPLIAPFIRKHQFGFRYGRSTYDNLLCLLDRIYRCFRGKRHLPVAFLDLKAAFDCLSHDALLYKLHDIGVHQHSTLHQWIAAFLTHRTMRVGYQGQYSDWRLLTAGVPQGCVLSPLLFLVFINDMPDIPNILILLYADDICIVPLEYGAVTRQLLQQALDSVNGWCKEWAMTISVDPSKSAVVIFRRSNNIRLSAATTNPYALGTDTLQIVPHYKYLGLILDSTLSWQPHFCALKKKIERSSYLLSRVIDPHISTPTVPCLALLLKATVRSQIAYALPLWQPTKAMLQSLQFHMLRSVRRVLCQPPSCPTDGILADTGLPSLRVYRQYLLCKLGERYQSMPSQLRSQHPACSTFFQYYDNDTDYSRYGQYTPIGYQVRHAEHKWHLPTLSHSTRSATHLRTALAHQQDRNWLRANTDTCIYLRDQLGDTGASDMKYYLTVDNKRTAAFRCRLRMRRSNLHADLHRFSRSPTGTAACPLCGCPSQTIQHMVEDCPVLTSARQQLYNQLTNIDPSLTPTVSLILAIIPDHYKRHKHKILLYTGHFIHQLNYLHSL